MAPPLSDMELGFNTWPPNTLSIFFQAFTNVKWLLTFFSIIVGFGFDFFNFTY
jgi:hypothetical protein